MVLQIGMKIVMAPELLPLLEADDDEEEDMLRIVQI